uniref:GD22670, related n=1 Tax=Neospora caninum (strain Liverpool) TaxID=572307 RepID=A0A0F7ULC9_NEOCL|nr:TPA: GD22670, related [Neospora caninum Liverpool]
MACTEEDVQQFMAATGVSDRETATRYIEMAVGDCNAAALLFFEHQEEGISFGSSPSAPPADSAESRRRGGTRAQGVSAATQDAPSFPSRSSSASVSAGSPLSSPHPGASAAHLTPEEEPRRPDPSYSQTLLTQPLYGETATDDRAASAAAAASLPSSLTVAMDAGSSAFAGLYEPPKALVCTLPFTEAKVLCMRTGRWLLVNIQKADEFDSHKLNRDIWRSEVVQDLLKEFFVFWQRAESNQEGRVFCELYKVTNFPHIAVVDPRTGRSMKQWTSRRFSEAVGAQSELFEFIEHQQQLAEAKAAAAREKGLSSPSVSPAPPVAASLPSGSSAGGPGDTPQRRGEENGEKKGERKEEKKQEERSKPDLQALREKRLRALEQQSRRHEEQ